METSNYSLDDLNNNNKKLAEFYKNKKSVGNELKQMRVKTSLLNVDSIYREIQPKNVCDNTNTFLPKNPITTTLGSSILKFNYPNHNLVAGDQITINNVVSFDPILSNSLFLINNVSFLIIYVPNHLIPNTYTNYVDEITLNISLISNLTERFYGSIPINMILGQHKIYTLNDITTEFGELLTSSTYFNNLKSKLKNKFSNITTDDDIYNNFVFVKLDFSFQTASTDLFEINDVFKVQFNQLNGIPLQSINADYPINYSRIQGNQEVTTVENDYFYIDSKIKAYNNGSLGGEKILVNKIIKTLPGYPNAGEFTIQLRKDFTDVVRMEMVSSEFPFTQFIVNKGINNKLYWQHLDDGDKIYSIEIPSGNYNASNLIRTITDEMNLVERISSTIENRTFNNFDITLNTFTNEIKFRAFAETLLPNSISNSTVTLQNKEYIKLTVKHLNNFVSIGDEITISNSEAIEGIPKSIINTIHKIYEINRDDSTYSFLLEPFNASTGTTNRNGGSSVKIKTFARVRFLFNYKDTLGTILNFKNAGDEFSITNFKSINSNLDDYIYPNNFDSVGNKATINNFLQLSGSQTYWLLYLNNYESVILNNGIDNSFSKILLPGVQGEVMFNSFVNNPVEFDIPIPTISELSVKVTDLYGNIIDFENTNFSFTIRIYQIISIPVDTGKFSSDISYDKEMIDKLTKDNINLTGH